MRFVVSVFKNGEIVRDEEIATISEVKSFLYGIREARNCSAYAYDRMSEIGYAMVRQESGKPLQECFGQCDDKFYRQLKKSTYHPEGKMVS
jgi:hypothetical protein